MPLSPDKGRSKCAIACRSPPATSYSERSQSRRCQPVAVVAARGRDGRGGRAGRRADLVPHFAHRRGAAAGLHQRPGCAAARPARRPLSHRGPPRPAQCPGRRAKSILPPVRRPASSLEQQAGVVMLQPPANHQGELFWQILDARTSRHLGHRATHPAGDAASRTLHRPRRNPQPRPTNARSTSRPARSCRCNE